MQRNKKQASEERRPSPKGWTPTRQQKRPMTKKSNLPKKQNKENFKKEHKRTKERKKERKSQAYRTVFAL